MLRNAPSLRSIAAWSSAPHQTRTAHYVLGDTIVAREPYVRALLELRHFDFVELLLSPTSDSRVLVELDRIGLILPLKSDWLRTGYDPSA